MRALLLLLALGLSLGAPAWSQKQKDKKRAAGDPGFYGVTISDVGKLVLISSIYRKTPAEKVARLGDLLLQIEGKPIRGTDNMIEVIKKRRAGTRTRFLVLRGSRVITLDVKLGKRPATDEMAVLEVAPDPALTAFMRFCETNPDSGKAWREGLKMQRKKGFSEAARLIALAGALGRYSELLDAEGPQKKKLEQLLRRVGVLLPLTRRGIQVPDNSGISEAQAAEVARRVKRLIGELGDGRFAVRQKASEQLARLGEVTREPLRTARRSANLEVRWRVRQLLELLDRQRERGGGMRLAQFEVTEIRAGKLVLRRLFGPPLSAGASYRAVVAAGKATGLAVGFVAEAADRVRQKTGRPAKTGERLLLLIRASDRDQ